MKPPRSQPELSTTANIPYPTEPRHSAQPWRSYHADRHGISDFGRSLTKQSEAQSCDINHLIATYGVPEPLEPGNFGDFSDSASFMEAQQIIAFANQQFAALPANVRMRFHNDPRELLEFCENSENLPEMIKMGLAEAVPLPPDTSEAEITPQERSSAALSKKKAPPVEET